MKSSPLKIVIIYLIAGLCWIFTSDNVLAHFSGAAASSGVFLQRDIFKGSLYVLVTAILLYFLIRHYFKALWRSQANYRKLFEENPCPMFAFDPATFRFVAVNEACVRQYGYTREQLLSMVFTDICHPCEADKVKQAALSSTLLHQNSGTWRHVTREGKELYVNLTVHKAVIGGSLALWAQVSDVTEARKNELLLTEAMERYDLVSKATNDLIWDWDSLTGKVSVNTAVKSIFARDLDDMKADWYKEVMHPEDSRRVLNSMSRTIAEGRDTWSADYRIKCGDGNYRYITSRAYLLYDQDNKVRRITGIAQDVTAVKQNALLLQEALERYDLTVKATNDVIWDWSAERGKAIIKGPFEENFGYKAVMIDKEWFSARIHPQDNERVWQSACAVHDYLGHVWAVEFRLRCADGSYKYVNNRAYLIYDECGRPVRATGVIQVIEQQKEYEKKIEMQNVLLKEIAQICSHELRGPVASIRGLLILLSEDNIDHKENKRVFNYLEMASMKLDNVIHRMMEKANEVYYELE
jgi:PAS domain S-box-containing protein